MMKAAVLHANKDLRYEDFPMPKVRSGTVKVKVRATGICGSDIPRVLDHGAHFYPIVLGHEFAGDVVEIGEGVKNIKVGDTVSGAPLLPCGQCGDCQRGNFSLCKNYSFIGSRQQGSFAQYVVIPEANAVVYDPCNPYPQAALFEPATVALHGIFCNDYQGGGTVAIIGGGTIGLFTMQWAKIFGAKEVTVLDLDDQRLSLAKELGADITVNTSSKDYQEKLSTQGYDYVFETAGSTVTIPMAFALAANKAKVCLIGTPPADMCFTPKEWEQLNRKEFALTGSWMSYSAPFPGKEWSLTAHYFATGQLKYSPQMIYKTFPLEQAAQAFALFENPEQVKGKVMLISE